MAALEPAKMACATSALNLPPEAVEQLQDELGKLRAMYSELEGEVRKRPRSVAEFIINPVSHKVHKPACAHYSQRPPVTWKSVCGWRFGLSPFLPSDERPPERACSRCIPELARVNSDLE